MKATTNLSEFDNSWYKPGGVVKRFVWYLVNLAFFKSGMPFSGIKVILLRAFGSKVGSGVVIKPHVRIKYPWLLSIGNFVWIGEEVWIDNLGLVTIEDHCCLSQGAFLLCGNHDYSKSTFDLMVGDITLKQGVWIGARSIVCPGVTCHSHAILAVASVATKDLDAYSVYQGNPATKIKDRLIQS